MPILSLLLFGGAIGTVASQCAGDTLVDDYATAQRKFFDNADRQINLMGGDYGSDTGGSTFSISTTTRTLTFTPNAPNNGSFFFAKYDERACFDLRQYRAFQFELLAPVNAYAEFTLTQTSPDCLRRVEPGDSVYIPLSRYYTTPGQWQTVTMHFSDFAENTLGGQFDFEHLKDWTMVNMLPLGQPVQFRNMRLLGGPFGCDGYTTPPKTQPPESTTAGPVVTPNVEIKKDTMINTNSAYSDRSFLVGLFAGLLPALYLILA